MSATTHADQAQRVADLEAEIERLRGLLSREQQARHAALAEVDRITEAGRVHIRRAACLESERDTARGALRELERQVFALQQQRDVLQTCLDRHQRDAADPPGYLQDAVIRAAGLGALREQRDAAIKERDELREQVAFVEQHLGVISGVLGSPEPIEIDDIAARLHLLTAERDAALAAQAQAREVLRALDHTEGRCPLCGWRGHAPDCKLSAAIARAEGGAA